MIKLLKQILYRAFSIFLLVNVLVACGFGQGNNSTIQNKSPNPNNTPTDLSVLNVIYPWDIPSLPIATQSYIIVQNTGNTLVSNLQYSITSATSINSNVIIDPISIKNCTNILANSSCNILLNIPANSSATGITFNISNSATNTTKVNLSANNTINMINNINIYMGISNINYNTQPNADGITLIYPHTINNTKGKVQILVNAIVSSAQNTAFNTINLVDINKKLLNATVISNNSGANALNLNQGSIVTFLLTVPESTTLLEIYPQTALTNTTGTATIIATATTPKNITTTKGAVPQIYPFYLNLSINNKNQIIIVHNNSVTESINKIVLSTTTDVTISNDTCSGHTLAPNTNCNYTISFDPNITAQGNTNIAFMYNDGVRNQALLQSVQYAGNLQGGLVINSNLNFTSNNLIPRVTLPLTITNTGNYTESNIKITLPNSLFSLNNTYDDDSSCSIISTSNTSVTLSNVLKANQHCNLKLTYNNSQYTPITTGIISITYTLAKQNYLQQTSLTYKTNKIKPSIDINNGFIISTKIGEHYVVNLQLTTTDGNVNNLPVNVSITDSDIAKIVGATSCNLSSLNSDNSSNTCDIVIKGLATNTPTMLNVTLPDGSVFSESVIVSNQISPILYNIIINNGNVISPKLGDTKIVNLRLTNKGSLVNSKIPINVSVENNSIASIDNNVCNLSSSSYFDVINKEDNCNITIKGLSAGSSYLKATLPDGSVFKQSIVVEPIPVIKVSIISKFKNIYIDETQIVNIQLTANGDASSTVYLSIENPNIASIIGRNECYLTTNNNGENNCQITVKGLSAGSSVLKATLPNGSVFRQDITVVTTPVIVVNITSGFKSIDINETQIINIQMATNGEVNSIVYLSIEDPNIASIIGSKECYLNTNNNGESNCQITIKGLSPGLSVLKATINGLVFKKDIIVASSILCVYCEY